MGGITGLDSSVLLGYYQSQLYSSPSAISAANVMAQQAAAQTQAFETQELARTDDSLQQTLQDALLFNAQAI